MKQKGQTVSGIIMPTFVEANGKMEKLMEVAKDKKVQKGYETLLKELKTDPRNLSNKLREVVWKGKNVDEIVVELEKSS